MTISQSNRDEQLRLEYTLLPWGDLIYGTKDELQALGLGQGMAFPGEPGGPRRRLAVTDSRGFPCKIARADHCGVGRFSALILIPGRERPEPVLEDYAPGVTLERMVWGDLYCGTPSALIKAGLVSATQFPGAPGMGKTVTKFLSDGTVAPAGCRLFTLGPGGVSIRRASTRLFSVRVLVDKDEENRRHQEGLAENEDYERRMSALPRPRPLVAADREVAAKTRRAQLRLVWSRPAPAFSIGGSGRL